MSEKDDKLNKGSFLYINDKEKAQWGFPEGYPHKEGSKTIIEWDGNTVGHEQAPYGGQFGDLAAKEGTYWHISDVVPTIEEMLSADFEVLYQGQMMNGKVSDFDEVTEFESFYFIFNTMAIVVKEPTVFEHEQNGYTVTFLKAGVYLMLRADGSHFKKLAYGTETIHPMASAFLPQANQTTYGAIKKAAHVPHVTEAPTSNDFNKLLSALREAGIMSQSE